jgi:hypothetical protein
MSVQPNFLTRAGQYVKALGTTGQLLTLLGLLPMLVDIIAPIAGLNIDIPSPISVIWFIAAFGLANFRVFEAQASSDVEIQIKEHHVVLEEWLRWAGNRLTLNPEITVTLHAQLNIINHNQRPTHVKLSVMSVDSEWIPAKKYTDFIVRVDRTISRGLITSDNPFILDAGEINDKVHVGAVIIFRVSDSERAFGYLGSLSRLIITLGAEQASKKAIPLRLECDVATIHQSIEAGLLTQVQNSRNNDNIPRQFLQILKQYWSVDVGEKKP